MSSTLLSPLRVGTLELKNRMAVAPMVTCYCDDDGMPTEQYLAPDRAALEALGSVGDIRMVGDAVEAADALKASRDGFACGVSIGREPVGLPMAGTDPRLVPAGSPRH